MINKERKLDTRNKIELGGLVIKAKLDYLKEKHNEVILGALIDAYNKIHDKTSGEHHFQFYQKLGEDAFKPNK
jgi:hypothetical protein